MLACFQLEMRKTLSIHYRANQLPLDTVELVMALEEEFETEIPDEQAEKITTVQEAIDYINAHAQ